MISPKNAVHQPAVDPVLAFQPFGHLDPERIAHRVRGGSAQPGVARVDRIKCGADLVLLRRLHATDIYSNICTNRCRVSLPVDELATVDNQADLLGGTAINHIA